MPDEMQNLTPPRGLIERLGSRLARVTTSGRRIRELDGLRFIAIFVVVVGHAMEFVIARYPADHPVQITAIPNLFGRMRLGVELFFVISGFILAMPFAQQHLMKERAVSLRAYYWRRVTRLEPPYILTMLLWFAVAVLFWGESGRDLFPHLLASLGYVHNIVYKGFSTINPVAWSLEIEVQFYILAPLLAIMFKINHRWTRRKLCKAGSLGYGLIRGRPEVPHSFLRPAAQGVPP